METPESITPVEQTSLKPLKLPPGEVVVQVVESATGMTMPDAEKAAFLEVSDDEAAAALLTAKLGPDFEMSTLQARNMFSSWLFRKIQVKPVLLTMHLATIEESDLVIKFAREALEKKDRDTPLTPEQEAAYIRVMNASLDVKSKMLTKAQRLAHDLVPETNSDKPKNKPPNVLQQTNVAVYTAGSGKPQR